jgi:hypothetical protein
MRRTRKITAPLGRESDRKGTAPPSSFSTLCRRRDAARAPAVVEVDCPIAVYTVPLV